MFKPGSIFVALCASTLFIPVLCQSALAASSSNKSPTKYSLSSWVSQVLSSHPQLQAARAAIDAAEGRIRSADRSLSSPELELDFERTETNARSAGVSQTLDWSNKREARTAVAEFERQAVVAEYRGVWQRVASELLRAIAQGNTARSIATASEKQVALMDRFVSLAERRRRAGDLDQTDLDLAHLAASAAAFQQSQADIELIRSNQIVASLTGEIEAAYPQFPDPLPAINEQQIELEKRVSNLPSTKIAQARIGAARAGVKLSLREKKADPTIGIRVGKEDSETLAGLTFSIPLFAGNRYKAEKDIASASVVQVSNEAIDLRHKARAEIQASARIYENARRTWTAWQTSGARHLAQRTNILNQLWQTGELNPADYLVQLQQTLETEISAIEQRGRMWKAWVAWLTASGQIEGWLAGDER